MATRFVVVPITLVVLSACDRRAASHKGAPQAAPAQPTKQATPPTATPATQAPLASPANSPAHGNASVPTAAGAPPAAALPAGAPPAAAPPAAIATPATTQPATVGPGLTETAIAANRMWSTATCNAWPEANRKVGTASVTIEGDGTVFHGDTPAVCGGLHTKASNRFAVGDGSLFRACLPNGSIVEISADVQLTGNRPPVFRYENFRRTGPLIEFFAKNIGVYNQLDPIAKTDTLSISDDWSEINLHATLHWPALTKGDKERLVEVSVAWRCPPR